MKFGPSIDYRKITRGSSTHAFCAQTELVAPKGADSSTQELGSDFGSRMT